MQLATRIVVAVFASCAAAYATAAIAGYPTPPGCAEVGDPTGPTFHVDPAYGDDKNTGSPSSPLKSLQAAIAARKFPPGSLVYLRTGNHGEIVVKDYPNRAFIHVKAAAGHTPSIRSLDVRATSHWLFEGLSVSRPSYHLMRIFPDASNVVLSSNTLHSVENSASWSELDWRKKASNGIEAEGPCSTVVNNRVSNVYMGIQMMADDGIAQGNHVSFFAADGMRANGSRLVLRQNRITDNLVVDDNHADGIQSFNIDGPGFTDQTLDGNVIIQTTVKDKPYDGFLQGIGFFDGPYRRLKIVNNVVIIPSYNGITVYDAYDSWIVNNTVTGGKFPWIMIADSKRRPLSSNVIVRNNLSNRIDLSIGATGDHNLLLGKDPGLHFEAYDPLSYTFDLHLKPTSRAIGAGSASLAPETDVEGTTRVPPIDIGAYQRRSLRDAQRR
jgi:hypothetical protein